jgi:hypothetical protein
VTSIVDVPQPKIADFFVESNYFIVDFPWGQQRISKLFVVYLNLSPSA